MYADFSGYYNFVVHVGANPLIFEIKKGWMAKEGTETIHPLYKLKGFMSADTSFRYREKKSGKKFVTYEKL